MKLLFFGTGPFAVPALRSIAASAHEVLLVVSQPDRPAGRRRELQPSPVKQLAQELDLPLFQPENVNTPESIGQLRSQDADLVVVADYGQLLKTATLEICDGHWYNLHGSLLPAWRGAAPVARAIAAGDAVTGVTVFRVVRAMDAGPVVAIQEVEIGETETAGELEARIADAAGDLMVELLDGAEEQPWDETPQNDDAATYAPKLSKQEGQVDWASDAEAIARHVRAMQPWPGAYSWIDGQRVELLEVHPVEEGGEPGEVLVAEKGNLVVGCGIGAIRIARIKPAGKAAMSIRDYLNGARIAPGMRFRDSL